MFHVPEKARFNDGVQWTATAEDGNNGTFLIDSPEPGWVLFMVASDGEGWEHVSVSARRTKLNQARVPTWKEMCFIKRLFWDAEDVVMQLHPKESEYVNTCPYCLHLWRPLKAEIPTPPAEFVGPVQPATV